MVAISTQVNIALAQLNPTLGDLDGNVTKIVEACQQAKNLGASLILTPELALTGYPPEDLLLRSDFLNACQLALEHLAKQVSDITLLVGYPANRLGKVYNAAALIQNGKIVQTYFKQIKHPFQTLNILTQQIHCQWVKPKVLNEFPSPRSIEFINFTKKEIVFLIGFQVITYPKTIRNYPHPIQHQRRKRKILKRIPP